ncbi:unnamed protein product [Lasius platythorax]|uniref:Integrase catalytic domain-containing protein n=1 Tax=Lasius platythorax TaxID=488582 RepID=A0AAV2N009_9HYME
MHQRENIKEPIGSRPIPNYPFEIVASDLFYKESDYIVLADNYFGFIKFKKLYSTTTYEVIEFFKKSFLTHGIPKLFETDNRPQFQSREFKEFAKEWKFEHHTSSPEHPRGNGFSEKAVHIMKNIIKKCEPDGSDVRLALLNYINTLRGKLGSPAQRLYSRRTRSLLPVTSDSLKPKPVDDVTKTLKLLREKPRMYADRGTITRKPLIIGNNVVMKTRGKVWKPARVTEIIHPRSVVVTDQEGHKYRRNQCDLKETKAQFTKEPQLGEPEDIMNRDKKDLKESINTNTTRQPTKSNTPVPSSPLNHANLPTILSKVSSTNPASVRSIPEATSREELKTTNEKPAKPLKTRSGRTTHPQIV